MSYVGQTLNFQQSLQRDEHEFMMSQMVTEAMYILDELDESAMIAVSEASTKFYESVWERIKMFFKGILDSFSKKAASLFNAHERWWKENEKKLEKLNFDGLSVEVYPYHMIERADMVKHIATVNGRISKEIRRSERDIDSKKTKTDDQLKSIALKGFLNPDGELIDGLKTFYRSGGRSTSDAKPITLNGNDLKSFVLQRAKPFVLGYKTASNEMQSASRTIEQNLKVLEREIKQRTPREETETTKEYFSLLTEEMWTIMEETNEVKSATRPADTKKDDLKPDMAVKKSGIERGEGEVTKDDASAMTRRQLAIFSFAARTFQQMFSVMLTIMEERLSAYMKISKGVLSAAAKPADESEKDGDKEKAN